MKIEVKNIKFYERLSEETNCFTADVYIDGKKAAYAKNDGQGGCTFYHAYDLKYRPLIEAAEAYAKTLPDKTTNLFGKSYTYKQTLESIIDDACTDNIVEKEQKKAQKRFETKKLKEMQYSILVGNEGGGYFPFHFKGVKTPLAKLSKEHLELLITKVKAQMKPGDVILNTNLEALGVKL